MLSEADLYAPVKAFLEAQGYSVKGEVGAADVVARREDEDPVIVELKRGFSLALYHQAIRRQGISEAVYIAVPRPKGRTVRRIISDNRALCRRLGIGLILVSSRGKVDVICDPGPYRPRQSGQRRGRLLREFERLRGDPNPGGSTRRGIVTAYRQDALACARVLRQNGPTKGAEVARLSEVPNATRIMADNHYGWFVRVKTGIYDLSEAGRAGLTEWFAG